jgi:hypothetical protein
LNPRKFAHTKEQIASDKIADAAAAAMEARIYELPRKQGGMDMRAEDAAHRAAMVSLGKRSILFRLGNRPDEMKGAIEELVEMLMLARDKVGRRRVDLDVRTCGLVAQVALLELAHDRCQECLGRGEVEDHSLKGLEGRQPMRVCGSCMGQKRRRYDEDERIIALGRCAAPNDSVKAAKLLRRDKRLTQIVRAVEFAKGELLAAERVAVEGAGLMIERWQSEDMK